MISRFEFDTDLQLSRFGILLLQTQMLKREKTYKTKAMKSEKENRSTIYCIHPFMHGSVRGI